MAYLVCVFWFWHPTRLRRGSSLWIYFQSQKVSTFNRISVIQLLKRVTSFTHFRMVPGNKKTVYQHCGTAFALGFDPGFDSRALGWSVLGFIMGILSVLVTSTESLHKEVLENRWTGAVKEVSFTVFNYQNQARYTFASGGSATPPCGKKSGISRRATPIRLSAIP